MKVVYFNNQLKVNAINPVTGSTNNNVSNTTFNLYTGTTAPNTFLGKSEFNTYSGATNTAIVNRLLTTSFNTYSASTLTNINSRLLTSAFNTYSGATLTNINTRLVSTKFNTYTGTTAPAQFASKSVFNTYTGATNTTINARLLTTSFNTYSASTLTNINSRLLTSAFNTYSGVTLTNINSRLITTAFNTYSGATGARLSTVESNYISGYTSLGNVSLIGSKLGRNLRFKGLIAGTNITLTPSTSGITIASTGGGGGGSATANNGLRVAGSNVVLGGSLTGNTTIGLGANNLTFTGSTGSLRYGSDLSANYNVRSLPDVGYVTGNTINKTGNQFYFTQDNSFNSGKFNNAGNNSSINSIAFQSNGKIVAVGDFTSYTGLSQNYAIRLNSDGTEDFSFNISTGFNNVAQSVIVQPDGNILVGGYFTTYTGSTNNALIRLNSNGQKDSTFNIGAGFSAAGGSQNLNDVALQSDGKIILAGNFTGFTGTSNNHLIRLNANGTKDSTFDIGTGFNNNSRAIAIQSDGKVIIGGQFTTFTGSSQNRIIRLNANGTKDSTFNIGTGFDLTPNKIVILSSGKILICGSFSTYNGTTVNGLCRLNTDGSIDGTFTTPNTSIIVTSIKELSNGKLLIGGLFSVYLNKRVNRLVQLNADGTIDTTIDYNAIGSNFYVTTAVNNSPSNIYTDANNRVYVTGQIFQFNNQPVSNIIKLTTNNQINVVQQLEYSVDASSSYSPRSLVDYSYITGNTVLQRNTNVLIPSCIEVWEDFLGAITAMPTLTSQVSGTGAANSTTAVLDPEGRPGIMQSAAGTTATGRAHVGNASVNAFIIPNTPSTVAVYETSFRIPTLSDATNRFIVQAGLADSLTAEATDGIYLRYTDNFNGGKFHYVTRRSAAQSTLSGNTTVVANTWYKFRFELSFVDGDPKVLFYLNGVLEGELTTNIPTGSGRNTSIVQGIRKTVGTTSRVCEYDYILFNMVFPR
jgi:uncharacterized delta-60 repeat protein